MLDNEGAATAFGAIDGRPSVQCRRDLIKTVKDSRVARVVRLMEDQAHSDVDGSTTFIISNSRLEDYRLVLRPLEVLAENRVAIDRETAQGLGVKVGDELRYVNLR